MPTKNRRHVCATRDKRRRDVCATRDESHFRLWQRRYHPFNVYSEGKRREKLNYMHNNPAKRGLVSSPGDWPWSSWRFYFQQDAPILRMDWLD